MRLRESGAIVFVLVAVVALAFLGFCLYALSGAMSSIVDPVQPGVPAASTSDAPFIPAWSIRLSPPLVHEMALSPGRLGHFLALDDDEILQFDSSGAPVSKFAAPPKSSRIATDPSGRMPYVMIVSRSSKWTGAIDHTVTTDHFLHALDTGGREVWKQRFDPKDVATLEPLAAGEAHGSAQREPWGKGDAPRRFRAILTRDGVYGISLRQVFGRALASARRSPFSTGKER